MTLAFIQPVSISQSIQNIREIVHFSFFSLLSLYTQSSTENSHIISGPDMIFRGPVCGAIL
jgi:hypothetical protein